MKILIAELGNNHQGNIEVAKDMVRIAKESGATMVKGQAFHPEDIKGSMDKGFYEQCELTVPEYVELWNYGEDIGIPVFYSIFSEELKFLHTLQDYQKYAACQVLNKEPLADNTSTFISVPIQKMPVEQLPRLTHANILYPGDYLACDPDLSNIRLLGNYYQRNIGYSCHCIGNAKALEAITRYDCQVVEKHFILKEDKYKISFNGKIFRDCIHSATPDEFEQLAGAIHGN